MGKSIQDELINCGSNVDKVIAVYQNLKRKISFINSVLGNLVLATYVCVIAYYCELPDVLMGVGDFNVKSIEKVIMHFFANTVTWTLAAEFHSMATKKFYKWHEDWLFIDAKLELQGVSTVKTNTTSIIGENVWNEQKLFAVENMLQREPLALSCKFFPVTYGFLGSTLFSKMNNMVSPGMKKDILNTGELPREQTGKDGDEYSYEEESISSRRFENIAEDRPSHNSAETVKYDYVEDRFPGGRSIYGKPDDEEINNGADKGKDMTAPRRVKSKWARPKNRGRHGR
ncbi:unnamed protein product [Orchesella dallaii]|uniref:Uncharacterized protein n=1 Tax=Orchesella dallaii TaxID=48710 RepID=A0ABP1QCQ2_9HEXA